MIGGIEMNISKLRQLAIAKKEELENKNESLDKINNIIDFLEDDMCFFKLNINLSVPILLYLGISEKDVKNVYFEIISPNNFRKEPEVRRGIDK